MQYVIASSIHYHLHIIIIKIFPPSSSNFVRAFNVLVYAAKMLVLYLFSMNMLPLRVRYLDWKRAWMYVYLVTHQAARDELPPWVCYLSSPGEVRRSPAVIDKSLVAVRLINWLYTIIAVTMAVYPRSYDTGITIHIHIWICYVHSSVTYSHDSPSCKSMWSMTMDWTFEMPNVNKSMHSDFTYWIIQTMNKAYL
jgi:hypothetical protein